MTQGHAPLVWAQSCGKTNHYPNLLTAGEGFIPAHAGKTSSFSWRLRRSAAHPRSREENILRASDKGVDPGSSPLTQGKHAQAIERCIYAGLIPAHAGKTLDSINNLL